MVRFEKGISEENKGNAMPKVMLDKVGEFDPAIYDITWTSEGGVDIECADPYPTPEMIEKMNDFLDAWRELEAL